MAVISNVAIFGATGNFGAPITAALTQAGFAVTIFTRPESTSTFPADIPVVKADYADEKALEEEFRLRGIDAVVSVLGPGAVDYAAGMVDAAYKAGVRRFIVNDFGWGFGDRALPEFKPIGEKRHIGWDRAMEHARRDEDEGKEKGSRFTWTGITIGNPIDWALAKFPHMGFNLVTQHATIYDAGSEEFTGTTLAGIGQSVVGVFRNLEKTANRFVAVRSIKTCQNELLAAFQKLTSSSPPSQQQQGEGWTIEHSTAQHLLEEGRRKHAQGNSAWRLDLLVYQLYAPGEARCVVGGEDNADSKLLGIEQESAEEVVRKALARAQG